MLKHILLFFLAVRADNDDATVEEDIGKSRDGSRTDDEAVQRSVVIAISQLFSPCLQLAEKETYMCIRITFQCWWT